jgi:hypothetical protein
MTESELTADEVEQVPDVPREAEIDPHFLDLRGGADLPALYMPPAMPGRHSSGIRAVALILIGIFVAATAAGVCLTYGAPHNPF